ncbi:hypothetical protein KVV02_004011 [Mortierella alpina]|uniref:FHF complex subunit HOOK-interacting protein C-terminal domain-containing protein n=1 Tax=Mortierella alpina TaxID=64518 RepID=A0A9P8D1K1_MORAP|nr:hypothetical protein KVV02_004011 [Mortierella alpina]
MENGFWNKLKKSILTTPKVQPSSAAQLTRFSKCWLIIQHAISTSEKRNVTVHQTEIPERLKNMVDLLVDEESRLEDAAGSTGVCMEHLLKHNILGKLANICAENDKPRGIIGETIRTMAGMINLLDDRFLVHNAVHKPVVKLLRTCCAPGTEMEDTESYHEDLIDLMYIICSKIHGYSELLNIFFYDRQWLTVPERIAARRLQKNKETMAMLKSLSQRSGLTASAAGDYNAASISAAMTTEQDPNPPLPKDSAPAATTDVSSDTAISNTDDKVEIEGQLEQDDDESKRDYEFLLFTYLSKFVHREGKAGDFARTGLLFLMELAHGSLGDYILDADFATYLTAGIGALYSQLPRKLMVIGAPSSLAGNSVSSDGASSPEVKPSRRANIELSTSADFQSRMDAFLKVLEFCQDVLMRCPNAEITSTLLSSFKAVFLESILYPSILECSDTDGSSVAVISYIDMILQLLEHEALVDLVVGFLMASDEDDTRDKTQEDTDAFAEVQNPQTTSPYFMATGRFTLKDLVLSRLKSRSQPTVIATLKLLNTVITRHCRYSLKLLSVKFDSRPMNLEESIDTRLSEPYKEVPRINHHTHELDLFFALISTINPRNTPEIFCSGYESYLRDAEAAVETHQCRIHSKALEDSNPTALLSDAERKKNRRRSMKYGRRLDQPQDFEKETLLQEQGKSTAMPSLGCCGLDHNTTGNHAKFMHRLLPSDPLLQSLLGTLSHFFAHTVELNLALTGVIASLANCPYRSLEGWLLFKASDVRKPDVDRGSGEDSDSDPDSPAQKGVTASQIMAQFGSSNTPVHAEDSDDEDAMPLCLVQDTATDEQEPPLPAGPPTFKSFPPFFTMLRTLTQQVDYYRSEIDGFDDFLMQKRRSLLATNESNLTSTQTVGTTGSQSSTIQVFNSGNAYGSSDLLTGMNGDGRGHVSMLPTMSSSTSSLPPLSPVSPRIFGNSNPSDLGTKPSSPASPRVSSGSSKTTLAPGSVASPVSLVKTRPRKSSSPSSLMSTPSNMSFLIPPGLGAKRSFKSNSASPLAGTSPLVATNSGAGSPMLPRYPTAPCAATDSVSNSPSPSISPAPLRSMTSSPSSVARSRAATTLTPRPKVIGGMVSAGHSDGLTMAEQGQGHNGFSPGALSHHGTALIPVQSSSQPLPALSGLGPLSKLMDTMMIKPLFADGFVSDSDSEAESRLDIEAELMEDGDSSNSQDDGSGKDDASNDADGSKSASESSKNRKSTRSSQKEKLVSLGQLLTNVVILEEVVKEVVAVAQVRKGMGVDRVRYV